MSNESNEPGPSRPKRNCTTRVYDCMIERMLFESESDENYDFSYSGSEYMAENSYHSADDSESFDSDVELKDDSGNVQNIPSQYDNELGEMDNRWYEEFDMPNFDFTKKNKLLVSTPGDGNPIDYFFLLFDEIFIQ